MSLEIRTLASGFAFPEGPRWHHGQLWFADMHGERVHVLNTDGSERESFDIPGCPSGMGWLPNGDLLVVSMKERRLYRRQRTKLILHADLSSLHPGFSNDMVVDRAGRAYVGNAGFDFYGGEPYRSTVIALVLPDGSTRVAAEDLACPNGSVITADGKTFIVAESMGCCLTEFDIAADGGLSGRRLFADLDGVVPDGMCLDDEDCVWVAAPLQGEVLRIRRGGKIMARLPTVGANPYACMLGGEDGHTLFICCAKHHQPHETVSERAGKIDAVRVPVAAAGWP